MATPGISDVYQWIAVASLPDRAPSDFDVEAVKSMVHRVLMECPKGLYFPKFMRLARDKFGTEYQPPDASTSNTIEALIEAVNTPDAITPNDRLSFKMGIYDHFKGGIYRANKFLKFASVDSLPLIIDYTSFTTAEDFGRFLKQWCEVVQWPDGKYRSRFVYRGPTLATPAPPFKVKSPEATA